MPITASILYDLVRCPHRVALDAFGDPALRDALNGFCGERRLPGPANAGECALGRSSGPRLEGPLHRADKIC